MDMNGVPHFDQQFRAGHQAILMLDDLAWVSLLSSYANGVMQDIGLFGVEAISIGTGVNDLA